jgi:hypothetical protein
MRVDEATLSREELTLRRLHQRLTRLPVEANQPRCPKCGAFLVVRMARGGPRWTCRCAG